MPVTSDDITIKKSDLVKMVNFILGWWPSYECAISWQDNVDPWEYPWFMAAWEHKETASKDSRENATEAMEDRDD